MIALKKRIADPRMLKLINKWLKAPVFEKGQFTGGKKNNLGTPQGGVVSPLLANIYMNLIDRIIDVKKQLRELGINIVRYADDFVLMGSTIPPKVVRFLKLLLNKMELTLNEEKTRQVDAREETFNFLGFTVRYSHDLYVKGKKYWDIFPSKKSEQKIRDKIKEWMKKNGHSRADIVVKELNGMLRGWLIIQHWQKEGFDTTWQKGCMYITSEKVRERVGSIDKMPFVLLVKQYGLIDPTKYSLT
jgi:RNA-directed DNA polymerase